MGLPDERYVRDDDIRAACFASLAVLCATHGPEVPYVGGLDQGFTFRGGKIPFMSRYKGIYRARAQRGPAALSIVTSWEGPYDDAEVHDGFLYAYRREGPAGEADNRALRAAFTLGVPIVYYVATRPGWYKPLCPVYVVRDDPAARHVLVAPGAMRGALDEREPVRLDDPIERRYAVRETRVRVHQARFRGRVLLAYADRCAICRLKETRLLDAAHIVGDLELHGEPVVSNGVSLCSIHHRAFDEYLVGVSPDYEVRVSQRLLDEDDGPMLDLLKGFDRQPLGIPERRPWRPDRARLAERFERFVELGG